MNSNSSPNLNLDLSSNPASLATPRGGSISSRIQTGEQRGEYEHNVKFHEDWSDADFLEYYFEDDNFNIGGGDPSVGLGLLSPCAPGLIVGRRPRTPGGFFDDDKEEEGSEYEDVLVEYNEGENTPRVGCFF